MYTFCIAIIHFKRSHIENKFRQLDKFTFNLSIFFNEMFSLQSTFSNWIVNIRLSIIYLVYACRVQSVAPPLRIDLFILKNMGAAIIDFRVCPPLVKCQNLVFSGFIDTLMYGFSSTGVTIYCYFGLKFNDNTCCEVICKW